MAGRRTKLTSEVQKTVCDNLLIASGQDDAATMAGVPLSTFYGWLRRGRLEEERLERSPRARVKPSEQPFLEFWQAVKKAIAQSKRIMLGRIVEAGREQWQANAWILERRFPREFGQKVLLEQQVHEELEAALDRLHDALPESVYAQVIQALAADGERAPGATGATGG